MRKGFSHWVFITLIFTSISTHANSSNGSNFETFGDITQVAIPLSGAFIAYFKNDEQGLVQLAEGALYTSLTTHTLKHLIEAKRPDGGDLNSFPSGHTSAAFQGAAFLHFRYGWKYGLPAYAFASAVGASRVDAQKHYWRDVVTGAGLAIGIQYLVTEKGYSISDFILTPYTNGETYGLAGRFTF